MGIDTGMTVKTVDCMTCNSGFYGRDYIQDIHIIVAVIFMTGKAAVNMAL